MKLSIIMPAYNEEECIGDAIDDIQRNIYPVVPSCELIVINDGSKDRTGAILDDLAMAYHNVRVIHQTNAGHGRALLAGMDAAAGDYFFLIDSDRQISLENFPLFWQRAQSVDGVFGRRLVRSDHSLRKLLTRMVRIAVRIVFSVNIYDANVPFKLFHRNIWDEFKKTIPPNTLTPSLFLALFALKVGFRINFIDVKHTDRKTGVVSIRHWKLLKFCCIALMQLICYRIRLFRYQIGHGTHEKA